MNTSERFVMGIALVVVAVLVIDAGAQVRRAAGGRRGTVVQGEERSVAVGRRGVAVAGEEGVAAAGRRGAVVAGEEGGAAVGRRGAVVAGEEGVAAVGRYGGVVVGERYEDHNGWAVAAGVATGIAVGTMLARPPAAATTVVVSGTTYWQSGGVYYARVYSGGAVAYQVVPAPAGVIVVR
jgi:hypothetical protein